MSTAVGSVKTSDGVNIVYEQHSGPSDVTLVLLHGWSGSRRYFDRNVDELAKAVSVCRIDLRFHGDSDKPAWGHYVFRLAADVREVLQKLKFEKVVMLGTSMGCSVIWAYCMLYGTNGMAGAVFVDQAPLQNRKPGWNLGSKAIYDEETLQKTIESLENLEDVSKDIAATCMSCPIDVEYSELLRSETMKSNGNALGKLMADHTHIDWRSMLVTVDIPCLNCIGAKSNIFPVEGVEIVGRLIPNCRNVIFPDENHWLYIENPSRFNTLVLEFIKEIV